MCILSDSLLFLFISFFLFVQELTEDYIGSPIPEPRQRSRLFRSHSESSDEVSELDLSHGKKDAFVLEVFIYKNTTFLSYCYARITTDGSNPRRLLHRLMTLMLWRTSTHFSSMHLLPQVCPVSSRHSHWSTQRLLAVSLLMNIFIPLSLFCV